MRCSTMEAGLLLLRRTRRSAQARPSINDSQFPARLCYTDPSQGCRLENTSRRAGFPKHDRVYLRAPPWRASQFFIEV